MSSPTRIYPFEACFFGVGTSGFNNLCQHCTTPPSWMGVQRVGNRRRVTALCEEHAKNRKGAVEWHRDERLSDKLPKRKRDK